MAFDNPVVGGSTLIRPAIKSPNYQPGALGWIIDRTGFAEFNNVTIRGTLQSNNFVVNTSGWQLLAAGGAQFNGNVTVNQGTITGGVIQTSTTGERIVLSVIGAVPTIEIYPAGSPLAATVTAFGSPTSAGIEFTAQDTTPQNMTQFMMPDLWSVNHSLAVTSLAVDAFLDEITAQCTLFHIGGQGDVSSTLRANSTSPDGNSVTHTTDGKVNPTLTSTTIGTSDTVIVLANATNVYTEQDFAYRCTVHVDMRNANVGGRLDFKLWDGAVGGTQIGGTNRRWTDNSGGGANNGGTVLVFIWKATSFNISSNVNLSAVKAVVTAGAAAVEVNAAYSMIIEQIGDATMITGL